MTKVKKFAQYELRPLPVPTKYNRSPRVHPYLVNSTLKTTESIASEIQSRCSLNRADVVSTLQALSDIMYDTFSLGDRIQLDGIGTFSISLTCPPVHSGEEIHAQNITVRNINFEPNSALLKKLRRIPIERAPQRNMKKEIPHEKRKQELVKWFSTNHAITRSQYQKLLACSREIAYNHLNDFVENGHLHKIGKNSHPSYIPSTSLKEAVH